MSIDKKAGYNRYIETLKREGIEFMAYPQQYTLNINMGDRIISAYASKNWWKDPKGGVTGNGAIKLVDHVLSERGSKSAFDNEVEMKAKKKALEIIDRNFQNRSFIGKLFTKKQYEEAIKELMK